MMISLDSTSLDIYFRATELSISLCGIQDGYHYSTPVFSEEKCHLKHHDHLLPSRKSNPENK